MRTLLVIGLLALTSCRSGTAPNRACEGDDCDTAMDESDIRGAGESGAGRGGESGDGGRSGGSGEAGRGGSSIAGAGGAPGAGGTSGTGEAGGGLPAGAGGSAGTMSGAGGATGLDDAPCVVDGSIHRHGTTFSQDCNLCLCSDGTALCTQVDCDRSTACPIDTCLVGNTCVASGTDDILAPDGCHRCTCDEGALYCTDDDDCFGTGCDSPSCMIQGVCYPSVSGGIPAGDGCNSCGCNDGVVSCTANVCERFDTPPCDAGSCEVDGVCYPSAATTEDDCCTCDDGVLTCTDHSWCEALNTIGKRCEVDGDCQPGLECRGSLSGERPVCIRDCGFGCPTGTVCADGIPDYNGQGVSNICMRPCNVSADCEAFGSVCDRPYGSVDPQRYCF